MAEEHTDGKVTLYHKTTGEAREYWPIDASAVVSAESSEWAYERTSGESAASETSETSQTSETSDTIDDFEAMTKEELIELATAAELTVKRHDGEDGEPLKADYVKALKRAAKKKAG